MSNAVGDWTVGETREALGNRHTLLYAGVAQKWVAEELAKLTGADVWLDGRKWCVVKTYTAQQQADLEAQFLIDNCMED